MPRKLSATKYTSINKSSSAYETEGHHLIQNYSIIFYGSILSGLEGGEVYGPPYFDALLMDKVTINKS